MKNEIIRIAILHPHAYPWKETLKKKNIVIELDELIKILQEEALDKQDTRRKVLWELDRIIYKAAYDGESLEDVKQRIGQDLEASKIVRVSIDSEFLSMLLERKSMNSDEKIKFYQDFVTGRISKSEYSAKANNTIAWLSDLFSCNLLSDKAFTRITRYELIEYIEDKVRPLIYENNFRKDNIVLALKKMGFYFEGNHSLFNASFLDAHKEFEKYVSYFINSANQSVNQVQSSKEFDLDAELFGLLQEVDTSKEASNLETIKVDKTELLVPEIKKVDKAEAKSEKVAEVSKITLVQTSEIPAEAAATEEILNNKEIDIALSIKANIENIAEILGCVLIPKEDYVKFKSPIATKEVNSPCSEVELLKKLVNPSEGATLSELYKLYQNVDTTDRSNIKAVLSELFNTLMLYGVEVDETMGKLGDEVEVDTKNILKDFILSSPADKDGIIKGTVKYSKWIYKEHTLMPAVIQPKK